MARFLFYTTVIAAGFWGYWVALVLHALMDSTAP